MNRTSRTRKKRNAFLESLIQTGGNVSRACGLVGMARQRVYEWRASDADFAAAWDEAVEAGTDELEEEARRRAFEGIEEPVFYKGSVCGTIRNYSDTLMIFLLKGRRPHKYRDYHEVAGPGGTPLLQPVADALQKVYAAANPDPGTSQ